jgi:hypothetical protein
VIASRWCLQALSVAVAAWQESGENPALFCYLIAWGTFAALRSRKFVPTLNSARHEPACSNRFFTSFIRSMTPRDSGS